jgi:hypothetical protein
MPNLSNIVDKLKLISAQYPRATGAGLGGLAGGVIGGASTVGNSDPEKRKHWLSNAIIGGGIGAGAGVTGGHMAARNMPEDLIPVLKQRLRGAATNPEISQGSASSAARIADVVMDAANSQNLQAPATSIAVTPTVQERTQEAPRAAVQSLQVIPEVAAIHPNSEMLNKYVHGVAANAGIDEEYVKDFLLKHSKKALKSEDPIAAIQHHLENFVRTYKPNKIGSCILKESMNRPLSDEERLEAAHQVGAGLFSYLQLQREIARQNQQQKSKENLNTLKVPIPKELLYNASTKIGADSGESDSLLPGLLSSSVNRLKYPLSVSLGLQEGFHSAKDKYLQEQKANMTKELEKAQQDYLSALMQVRKTASTPAVDALCVGLAASLSPEEVEKRADDISDGAVMHQLIKILKHTSGSDYNPLKHLAAPAADAALAGLTIPALAGGAFTYNQLRPRREEGPSESTGPTKVELQPV